jgi:hypothetical protein
LKDKEKQSSKFLLLGINSNPKNLENSFFNQILPNHKILNLNLENLENIENLYTCDFYKYLLSEIKNNQKYTSRISIFKNYFNIYQKYSKENFYSNFINYINKLGYLLKMNKLEIFNIFEAHEKFSFNSECIPDESIIIIQALSIKKNLNQNFELLLNRTICNICNKEVLYTPRIILNQCQHCYCFDCMEIFCKRITKGSMKNSDFYKNKSSAFCQVKNCNSLVLFSDVEKLGKMYGEVKESQIINYNFITPYEEVQVSVCEICHKSYNTAEEHFLNLFCCNFKICKSGLLKKIEKILKEAEARKSTQDVKCPFCNNLLGDYIIEFLLGYEEYKKRFL